MTFISENGVRKAVQNATGHGFAVGYFTLLIGTSIRDTFNICLALGFILSVLVPCVLLQRSYVEWAVNKVKEGNQ